MINFRDDAAHLTLWKAKINLEFHFGSEASTVACFQRAVNSVDHFKLCEHMIDLYKRKGDWDIAEKFVELNLKKSNKGKRSWSLYIEFLHERLSSTQDEEAQQAIESKIAKTLSRAKQSLSKMDYTYLLTQKAINEFKSLEQERGQTSFNSLVASNPNRTDIWIVYLDMMVKYCQEHEKTRSLFNRVVSQKIKPKSMKTVFVKYLNFEKEHGDAAKVANVKRLAQKFIEEQIRKKGEAGSEEDNDQQQAGPKASKRKAKFDAKYKDEDGSEDDQADGQMASEGQSDDEDGIGI